MFSKHFLPLFCALGIAGLLGAVQPQTDIRLSAGWRADEIKTLIVGSATLTEPNALFRPYFSDHLQVRDIHITQIGVQGQLAVPYCWCDCYTWWLSQFYLKGYAYWGNVYSGRYSAFDKDIPETNPTTRFGNLGDVHGGDSRNFNIGLGWLYPISEDFGIGISGGYQYDRLDVKVKNMLKVEACDFDTDDDSCTATAFDFVQEGLKYKTKWDGPWLGVNVLYASCDYRFNIGYEYHWVDWKGSSQLRGADQTNCSAFTDRRHGSDGHGNVVFVEAGTNSGCWEFILGAKYSAFTVSGRRHPENSTFFAIGCPADEIDKVKKNKWYSFQLTFDIGYQF